MVPLNRHSVVHDESVRGSHRLVATLDRGQPRAWDQLQRPSSGACSLAGRNEEAGAAVSAYMRLHPIMTINKLRSSRYSDHPAYLAWRERFYEGLRKAGLPE